jgi:hypothetical protein
MPQAPDKNVVITATVPNSRGNGFYDIKQMPDGSWFCNCPAWRVSARQRGLDQSMRQCKHMEALVTSLGGHVVGAYDAARRRATAG